MRSIVLVLLGAALAAGAWQIHAHWGAPWAYFASGFVGGVLVGAAVTWVIVNIAFANSVGRAFGW